MTKTTKLAIAISGVIIAAVLAVFIFVPGLVTYVSVNIKYDHINDGTAEFEKVEVPDDFVSFDVNGITMKVPNGADYNKTELGINHKALRYNGKILAFVTENNYAETEAILTEYDPEYDPFQYYDNTKADYQNFFKRIGEPFPKDTTSLLYFTRDKLNSKMCLRLRGTDMKVFREMAETKEGAYETENIWHTSGTGYTAYISQILQDSLGAEGRWTASVFPDGDDTKYYFIVLNAETPELSRQILSTIELT